MTVTASASTSARVLAIATLVSRGTGFARTVATGATLGAALGSAFGVANSLPNMVTEVVLGSVLSALVVPVLVRAETEDADGGELFARRLLGICLLVLGAATVVAVSAAPVLVMVNLGSGEVNTAVATAFAYLLLPQILFYGLSSLFIAQLNTAGRFTAGAWAPVANNLFVLAIFGVYWSIPGEIADDDSGSLANAHLLLLGIGTTAGVVIQAAILVIAARRAGFSMRPAWGLDPRLRSMATMGAAITAYVAIQQVGLVASNLIGAHFDERAPFIYQQVWLLLQVPYGVFGVAIIAALTPRLARNAAQQDHAAVRADLATATSSTLLTLIPAAVFLTVFSREIATALFAFGRFTDNDAALLGQALSASAFTLVPYAVVLVHLRVFYAYQKSWTPTLIAVAITGAKVAFSLAAAAFITDPAHVVTGLTAANGASFVVGVIVGAALLHRTFGRLGSRNATVTGAWTISVSLIAAGISSAVDNHLLAHAFPRDWGNIALVLRLAASAAVVISIGTMIAILTPLRRHPILAKLPGPRFSD